MRQRENVQMIRNQASKHVKTRQMWFWPYLGWKSIKRWKAARRHKKWNKKKMFYNGLWFVEDLYHFTWSFMSCNWIGNSRSIWFDLIRFDFFLSLARETTFFIYYLIIFRSWQWKKNVWMVFYSRNWLMFLFRWQRILSTVFKCNLIKHTRLSINVSYFFFYSDVSASGNA